jgi:hypothetical protein
MNVCNQANSAVFALISEALLSILQVLLGLKGTSKSLPLSWTRRHPFKRSWRPPARAAGCASGSMAGPALNVESVQGSSPSWDLQGAAASPLFSPIRIGNFKLTIRKPNDKQFTK